MKAVMLMFDSVNRHMLSAYGCDWTQTPNFARLAKRAATFDRAYVGSMPCMPARRELHTGRPNFLHAPWGALEPFDDSAIELLKKNGVHTHMSSDHYHYWEEGAGNYHTKFNTWDFARGQEGDPFIGQVAEPTIPRHMNGKGKKQDWINRPFFTRENQWPIKLTVDAGLAHIDRNKDEDRWFLQIECFDPHEPFFTPDNYKELFPKLREWGGPLFDWPGYRQVTETLEEVEIARLNYATSLAMVDAYLGKVLDKFDELDLWQDTMLIVNTDHGFLLGEHNWWAKNTPPWYEELSHVPLFIHDPRSPHAAGTRRQSFVQTIDIAPTLLEYFGIDRPADMIGRPLAQTIADDTPAREAGLFGGFGAHVNVTDGRYVYMRAPVRSDNQPGAIYTLMPVSLRGRISQKPKVSLADAMPFSKGLPVLRIESPPVKDNYHHSLGNLLWDVHADPQQTQTIDDPAIESRMVELLVKLMRECDAPPEQFARLGLQ